MKLTEAQCKALKMIEKRDWPAGEPRSTWFHKSTLAKLVKLGLVEERFPNVVYLTYSGRAALSERSEG